MGERLREFIVDDSAQEVTEYAFLALFVGLIGLLLWPVIVSLMGERYEAYNDNLQEEVWEPPPIP